jgi:hypothetical protein
MPVSQQGITLLPGLAYATQVLQGPLLRDNLNWGSDPTHAWSEIECRDITLSARHPVFVSYKMALLSLVHGLAHNMSEMDRLDSRRFETRLTHPVSGRTPEFKYFKSRLRAGCFSRCM